MTPPQTPATAEGGWTAEFTPAPWKLNRDNTVSIPFRGQGCTASAYGGTAANARLIAAAPTHDECLWNAVALFGSLCTDEPQLVWLAEAKASLAKARGEER